MPGDAFAAQILLGVAFAIVLLVFTILADLTQIIITPPRALMNVLWRARWVLMAVSGVTLAAGLYLGVTGGLVSGTGAAWLAAGFGVLFYAGFINVSYVMFNADGTAARFVGQDQASPYLGESEEVAVVDLGNEARAYPTQWLSRHHVAANAGEPFGDEDSVMTFCGLTNGAIAFSPEIGGERVELGVGGQQANNLLLYDRRSNRLIQQLYGGFEPFAGGQAEQMPRQPVRLMRYGVYRKLYPQGRVYFNPLWAPFRNPVLRLLDRLGRFIADTAIRNQKDPRSDKPFFPTIPTFDDRLPNKTFVYAFDIADDRVAYTKEFLIEQGNRVEVTIGGEAIVLVHFPDLGFVDAFKAGGRDTAGIGPDGVTAAGETLERQVMIPEIIWMVWANYFRDTALNRL